VGAAILAELGISSIRSRFPVFQKKIYLNSCSQGALSDKVEASFQEYLHSWHKDGSPWDLWVRHYEAARGVFAGLIGAESDEVALVASASAGVNGVASALCFRERNRVVLGEFEFPTMGHIWLAQRPRGAEVLFVSAENERLSIEGYRALINSKTLIVPMTHICFRNGFRMPTAEIVRMAHDHGALALLDDYQDCGTRPIDVKAMDLDFYVSGTLKYLLGPPGLAFMYVRKSLAERLTPTITGWFGQANPFAFNEQLLEPAPNARRFESGTPPIPSIYGASAGVQLLREIGLGKVAGHIKMLTTSLLEGARSLRILVKTPPDSVGPLVVLKAKNSDALVQKFAEHDVVLSNRHDGLRISFHIYNTPEDVELVLRLLESNLDLLVRN
jgi:selenocysteine lyase/cysteine desulfurase